MYADNAVTPTITHKANKLPIAHFLVLDLRLRCSVCWYACSCPKKASGKVGVGVGAGTKPSSSKLLRWEFASKSDCDGWMTVPLLACCSMSSWSSPSASGVNGNGREGEGLRFRLMLRAKDNALCRLVVRLSSIGVSSTATSASTFSTATAGVGALGGSASASAGSASEDERASWVGEQWNWNPDCSTPTSSSFRSVDSWREREARHNSTPVSNFSPG